MKTKQSEREGKTPKGDQVKIYQKFAIVALTLLVLFFGAQWVVSEYQYRKSIESAITPIGIIKDTRSFFSSDGLFTLPEKPADIPTTPEENAELTYRYTKLLQEKFPRTITRQQIQALGTVAEDTSQPNLVRLYAYAGLHRAEQTIDRAQVQDLIQQELATLPQHIDAQSLSTYTSLAEVSLDLDPNFPKRPLTEYKVDSEPLERQTVALLTQTYLFSNENDVKKMFPELQEKIRLWSFEERDRGTLDRYLLSSAAYIDTTSISLEEWQDLTRYDSTITRCGPEKTYIAFQTQDSTACSLILTEIYYSRGITP